MKNTYKAKLKCLELQGNNIVGYTRIVRNLSLPFIPAKHYQFKTVMYSY